MTFLYVIVSFTGNDQAYLKILVKMIHLVGRPATVTIGRPNVVGRPTTQSWATSNNFFSARSFLSKSDGADRTRLFLSDLHRLIWIKKNARKKKLSEVAQPHLVSQL